MTLHWLDFTAFFLYFIVLSMIGWLAGRSKKNGGFGLFFGGQHPIVVRGWQFVYCSQYKY